MEMWHIYAMQYYSATKKTAIMSFAAIWMNLEIVITQWSKSNKGILYNTSYKGNLKRKDTTELTYKTEIDS